MDKLSNKKMVLLLVAISGTAFAWTPHDSTNDWNVASGNASVAANFNPASAPGANTLVRISNGGEMAVDSDLSWGALWVGRDGTGTVHQSSGELTLNNAGNAEGDGTLWLGYSAADMGLYHLSGGILDIQNGNPQIGRNGGGVLDVSGGEVRIAAPYPSVGRVNGGHGFVDVHGTGVFDSTAAQQTTVGEGGLGVVSVRDGGEVRAGRIVLGSASSTGRGMVNVSSGGTLSAKVVAGGAGSFKKINASGGTVKPNTVAAVVTNYMEGVQTTVGAGGLAFDTDGRAVTLRSAVSPSRLVTGNLAHRWSFNGGLADSVGGMDASLVGTRTAGATYADGEIRLPGAGAWTAAVNLGAGCIPSGRDGITIEIWATQLEYRNWSRLFTADGDDSRMYLAWAWGSNMAQDCFYLKTSGTVRDNNVSRLPPWTHGFKFHVTFVFEKQGDGSWGIRICKRNALTGGPIARYETTVPGTWDPADIATKYFYLGRSSDANEDACASYDEVRIWNVALNESELIESTVRGPDADFSSATCFRKTGAGTLTLASAADYAGATRVAAGALALCAPEMPVHRWSFENGSIADVNTGAEAVRVGGASSGIAATADGKGLSFPGASHNGAYMKLGKGNIPAGDRGFTFEVWATLLGLRTWERIFTIATDDISDACFMTWVGGGGTDNTKDYVGFRFNNGSMTTSGNKLAPYNIGQPYHVAIVVLPKDGGWVVRFYKQNATTGELENWYGWALPSGWTPDRFTNANISVAWSSDNGNDDANARYDEIRVWNRAFTEDEIVASGRLGPDVLPVFAYAEGAAGALPASTELTVDSDASFMLGGASQTVAALAGEGTVEGPGTLAVTGAIRPGGNSAVGTLTVKGGAMLSGTAELDLMPDGTCDRIDFAPGGTYDISGIHWTVSNVAATASCNSFIVANASGATLTGEIDASGLPANHVIKQTRDGNLVFKRIKGTMLIVQ